MFTFPKIFSSFLLILLTASAVFASQSSGYPNHKKVFKSVLGKRISCSPLELSLIQSAKDGSLDMVKRSLHLGDVRSEALGYALCEACAQNHAHIVEYILTELKVDFSFLQDALLVSSNHNCGPCLTLFFLKGLYDPADLRVIFTAALLSNSPNALEAILAFPKFKLTPGDRTAALRFCREKRHPSIEALLLAERRDLPSSDAYEECVIF